MFFQSHIPALAAAPTLPARRWSVANEMCDDLKDINDDTRRAPMTFGSLREGAELRSVGVLTFDMVKGSWLSGQGVTSGVTMVRMR